MEREPEDYIEIAKDWVLDKKDDIYKNIIKDNNGESIHLSRYDDEVRTLGESLIKAIQREDLDKLRSLGWPEDLMDCLSDPSVNLVITNFIELACIRFPNTNSKYNIAKLKEKLNVGLE
jgi:hypothetical protein